MDTEIFKLKRTDSALFFALLGYMDVSFRNERIRLDGEIHLLNLMCSLEEAENNEALQYEDKALSEQKFINQPLHSVIHNDLSKRQRAAFLLKYSEGYSIKEVSVFMGITPRAVKLHIDLALEKIRLKEADIWRW